jgi:regulation of enolase protein 1 (concanavalin A-like superfamily)
MDGKHQGPTQEGKPIESFQGRSTWLKLERRGDNVTAFYSHDGQEWTTAQEIVVEFPQRMLAGVAAVNTSKKPFAVEFDEFRVTSP